MRQIVAAALAIIGLALVVSCAPPRPPVGRWQGLYEGPDVMIVARLQIDRNGTIRVSAPNAFQDFSGMAADDRAAMRGDLMARLAQEWPHVVPMPLTFDGKVFRKPDGVAPQLEWDANRKQMTLIVYPGLHATIRMTLQAVRDFEPQTS